MLRKSLIQFSVGGWSCVPSLLFAAAAAKSLQSCPTLCDLIDGSPPGSTIPGILQARTLEWVAISFSNAWKWKVKVMSLSHVRLLATPWPAAYQAPLSMGFARQESWSGVPVPSPHTPSTGRQNLNHWTSREVPLSFSPLWSAASLFFLSPQEFLHSFYSCVFPSS